MSRLSIMFKGFFVMAAVIAAYHLAVGTLDVVAPDLDRLQRAMDYLIICFVLLDVIPAAIEHLIKDSQAKKNLIHVVFVAGLLFVLFGAGMVDPENKIEDWKIVLVVGVYLVMITVVSTSFKRFIAGKKDAAPPEEEKDPEK